MAALRPAVRSGEILSWARPEAIADQLERSSKSSRTSAFMRSAARFRAEPTRQRVRRQARVKTASIDGLVRVRRRRARTMANPAPDSGDLRFGRQALLRLGRNIKTFLTSEVGAQARGF